MEKAAIRLLMVEDNPGDARLVQFMLSDAGGFDVAWVETLADAIKHINENEVDAVLLDLSLPDSHGMGTVQAVREAGPNLPIVIFTGLDDEEMGLKAVQEGCQDYLVKGQGDENLIRRTVNYAIERKGAEQALRESEDRYRGLVELSPDAIVVHRSGEIVFVNREAVALFGATESDDMVGKQIGDLVHPDVRDVVSGALVAREPVEGENRYLEEKLLRLDGTAMDVEVAGSPIGYQGAPATQLVIRDITERKRAEEGLRLAATVFQTTAEAIMVTDAENRIQAVNPAFTLITGYGLEEVENQTPGVLNSGRHDAEFYKGMWDSLSRKGHWEGEIWNRRKSGEVYPEWLSITAIRDDAGDVLEYVAVFSDITKRKQDEEQIRRQANYDALTGLPNRTLFFDRLSRSVIAARRERGMVALLFIDLDRFKVVNDTLGHAFGDMLLEKAAKRLTGCVREADTVARLGGDEFTIILRDIHQSADAALVAEEVIESIGKPFQLDGNEAFIGASIGITIYPNDADDPSTMLRNADMAMYKAKEAGRNAFRFFTPEMDEQALTRMSLEYDLRHALHRDEFSLCYQPILETESGALVGVEALLRWTHPERGSVPPSEFIPVAEDTGVIMELGEWVLRSACRQAKIWRDAGHPEFWMSVNLSSAQIKRGLTAARTQEILAETGLPSEAVAFEITERLIMGDTKESVAWLDAVEAMGVKLSVDDFGTGYSSLNYLRRFPVDMVKIDQSFVANAPLNPEDAALVEAVIALAHSLDLTVVGEGVETEEQLAFLAERGCDLVQGYHFGRPMTAEDFEGYLKSA